MERTQDAARPVVRMTPRFSIVMPSYLGAYANAASDREAKFRRAVNSVLGQSFMSWELLIVADGCETTVDLYRKYYAGSSRIKCIPVPKQTLWSTAVRNWGLSHAEGEFVVYLDTDDQFGHQHLEIIESELRARKEVLWGYFNDLYWSPQRDLFTERICDAHRKFAHGTSNVVHLNRADIRWPADATYLHDHHFVKFLSSQGEGVRLKTPEYFVCHDVTKAGVKFDV